MKKLNLLFLFFIAMISFSACYYYPGEKDIVNEQLVALSQWNKNYHAKDFLTFYIPDSVLIIKSKDKNENEMVMNATTTQLINTVIKNMEAYGYTRTDSKSTADLGIIPQYVDTKYVTAYYPGYYYWDPYYWGYPYYSYPYYTPYFTPVYYSSYTIGAFVIEIGDLKNARLNNTNTIDIEFRGSARMFIDGQHTLEQMVSCINDCFNQTPILNRNN